MRVLHLGKYYAPYAGGIENFLLDLVNATHARGVANAVLVHQSSATPAGFDHGLDADQSELLFRARCYGQFAYAPVSPGFGAALSRMIREFKPSVLHLHLPNTSAFWALFSPVARQLPWVVHWHSDVVGPGLEKRLRLLYPFYRPFEQRLLGRARKVIATSPDYLQSSQALQRWRHRTEVVPLGLDPGRLKCPPLPEPGPWRNPGHLRVLAVGRLARYKGYSGLIDAVSALDNVELIIAGQGPLSAELQRQIENSGAVGRIHLAGGVDNQTRNQWLASCDLLALPSINRAEAFGLCLVEAMAAGKPSLATTVPGSGMSWVVEHERTGWLVPPGDRVPLIEQLAHLQDHRELLSATGDRARVMFGQRFHIDQVADRMVELYRRSLKD
jgi:glycosyltransferase involved in cell wall biosynthesis